MEAGKVYFVGAGPGAEDLLTLRGAALLEKADVVVYAGSLVNPALLKRCKPEAEIYDSARLDLNEVLDILIPAAKAGKHVVRLHTGDPSVYGAHREQMDALKAAAVPFEVCPGVSSFFGAAASLGAEYTLPGVSQTVILTRAAGRTPVPEKERLSALAAHGASLVLFLSAGRWKSCFEAATIRRRLRLPLYTRRLGRTSAFCAPHSANLPKMRRPPGLPRLRCS